MDRAQPEPVLLPCLLDIKFLYFCLLLPGSSCSLFFLSLAATDWETGDPAGLRSSGAVRSLQRAQRGGVRRAPRVYKQAHVLPPSGFWNGVRKRIRGKENAEPSL